MNLDRIVPKISKFSIVDLFARNWGCIKTGCIILSKVWSSWDYLTAVLSEKKLTDCNSFSCTLVRNLSPRTPGRPRTRVEQPIQKRSDTTRFCLRRLFLFNLFIIVFILDWPIFVGALFGKLSQDIACINPFWKPQDQLFVFPNNIKT